MKFYDAINNFLYDNNFFVSLYDDKIHVFNYNEIKFLSQSKVMLFIKPFFLEIIGNSLIVVQLNKEEITIQGDIKEVKKYEK